MSQSGSNENWFWLQSSGGSLAREGLTVMRHAKDIGYKVGWGSNPVENFIPVGDVDYCESRLKRKPKPNFAPLWLADYFHRKIETIYSGVQFELTLKKDCFVKSADEYKKYPAKVYKVGETLPFGSLLLSDVVEFTQEWRYYVSKGEILATGWYSGDDEDEIAPELNLDWPSDYSGAVDFGRLTTGEIALVEAQDGYACGWYGDDGIAYTRWLAECWKSLNE